MKNEKEVLKSVAEDVVRSMWKKLLMPELRIFVKESSNPFDDMLVDKADEMVLALIDKISAECD